MIQCEVAGHTDDASRGGFRAFYQWLTGSSPSVSPAAASATRPAGSGPNDPTGEVCPERIGHYTVERKLGEGGMGVVYAARDERLGRTIALKTLSAPAGDETARQRLWREARAAASVNHPNVCQIHEIGEEDGRLFIAMELLEGETLDDRLHGGPLAPAEAIPIGLGILAALGALHGRGIVHRDLKPSNVFLTPHGVKVLDFGLASARPARRRRPRDRPDAHRHRHGHAALHGARAGGGRAGRHPQRSLRRRHDPLRDARRPPGVRRPGYRRGVARDALRAAAGAQRLTGGSRGRSRAAQSVGQAARRSAGVRRRDGRRAARDSRSTADRRRRWHTP